MWDKILPGVNATRVYLNPFGMRIETKDSATASWLDGAWDPAPYQSPLQGGWTFLGRALSTNNGAISILNPQIAGVAPSNPVGNSAGIAANTLYAKNIPKMFAKIVTDGAGGVSFDNPSSFNINAVTLSPTTIDVTLTQIFNSTSYVVLVTLAQGGTVFFAKVSPTTGASFNIELRDVTGAFLSAAANVVELHVVAFGRQG